jgi:hypothetical protein
VGFRIEIHEKLLSVSERLLGSKSRFYPDHLAKGVYL